MILKQNIFLAKDVSRMKMYRHSRCMWYRDRNNCARGHRMRCPLAQLSAIKWHNGRYLRSSGTGQLAAMRHVRSGCPVAQAPRFPVAELAVLREPRRGSFQKGRMNSSFFPGRITYQLVCIPRAFRVSFKFKHHQTSHVLYCRPCRCIRI